MFSYFVLLFAGAAAVAADERADATA